MKAGEKGEEADKRGRVKTPEHRSLQSK